MKLILVFVFLCLPMFGATFAPYVHNPWSTNVPPNPVEGANNLSVTNIPDGKRWEFYGVGSNAVARLSDIGSSLITSVDPTFFEVLSGQLNLTNQNLVDWSQLGTNAFLTTNKSGFASANTAFTSLLNASNPPVIKTISAGSNVTVTDNTTNLVIASSNPGGTVTSVGLVAPSIFGVTNSPITGSGNIGFTNVNQAANTIYAGPSTGAVAEPAFRALVFDDLPALQLTNSIGITVDGGGSVLTTGQKGYIRMPYSGTLRRATVMADQNGNLVFDVWKSTTFPPTVANTITASAKPTLTSTNWVTDSTLTGWTNSFVIGDYIGWNVDSASTVTRATLQLDISH